RFKHLLLFAASLGSYLITDAYHLPLMVGSLLFDFILSRYLGAYQSNLKISRLLMAVSLVKNLGIILFFSAAGQLGLAQIPYGYLIYSLGMLSYMLDLYRGAVHREENFVYFGLFTTFFPALQAGPIVEYAK